MLQKIISVKNIGRFRNSAAPGNPKLSRHTLIHGANGSGKTTLCAVLRSLRTGDAAHIAGRQTLGAEDPPSVKLLVSDRQVSFDGEAWSASCPEIAIFDGVFIAENVHSGEVVEIDHRRNLHRIIIGEQGVRLAEEDSLLAEKSRDKTTEITAVKNAIQPNISPAGMDLAAFLALPFDPDIDSRIIKQQNIVEAAHQAQQINDRSPLSEIAVPSLPDKFIALLARTIDDIAQDAENRFAEHLAEHGMKEKGSKWIAQGMEQTDRDTCPFCGQNIQGLPLIAAYQAVFDGRYTALRDDIVAMRHQISNLFGDGAIGQMNTLAEKNKNAAEFWKQFCTFDLAPLTLPQDLPHTVRAFRDAALALLQRKEQAPLELLQPDATFQTASAAYTAAQSKVQQIAAEIRGVNALVTAKKKETGSTDVQAAEAELARLKAIKVRHASPVADLCADHDRLKGEKDDIDRHKHRIRTQLNEYARDVLQPYEERINKHLDAFNAGFQITDTKRSYPGGKAASSYRLVINKRAIDLGDGRTSTDRPSFKNTLSSGDRSTLALAFFLAHLEQDQDLAKKTVVFDDPFTSQDAFRRLQTVHEITMAGQKCSQVIVLSHDATFLKQVWDKAPAAERTALTLADHRVQGSKIVAHDLDRACQRRTATDIDDLLTYFNIGVGNPQDLIRKMRTVLETYCWTIYPSWFQGQRAWLGDIVREIRDSGDQHPARNLYDDLNQINDYTKQYHHGENVAGTTPDQIDPQELTGYVKRTLKIIKALQA